MLTFVGKWLLFFIVLSNYEEREEEHNYKEGEIECRENEKIFSRFPLVMLGVFSEGYEARKRRDDRSAAADVYTEQKLSVIIRESREEYRGGNVAYKLTGECADEQRALIEQEYEDLSDGVYSRHISRENEEENKG